jgi:hypothetical protein
MKRKKVIKIVWIIISVMVIISMVTLSLGAVLF